MEKKKRLRLKTEKIDGEEMVVMECATCHRRENVEADIAFECWEFDGGPFPVFDCPFCETGMMIPKQVIEETKAAEEKEIEHLYIIIVKCNNLQIPKQYKNSALQRYTLTDKERDSEEMIIHKVFEKEMVQEIG